MWLPVKRKNGLKFRGVIKGYHLLGDRCVEGMCETRFRERIPLGKLVGQILCYICEDDDLVVEGSLLWSKSINIIINWMVIDVITFEIQENYNISGRSLGIKLLRPNTS